MTEGSRGGGCGNSSFVFVSAVRLRQQALGEVGVAILRLFLFLQCVCDSRLSGRWVWQLFVCFCFCSAFATAGSRGGECGNSSFVFVSAVRLRQQALGKMSVAILRLFLFLQCVCDGRLSGRWVWQFFVCFCFCSAFATAGSRGGGCGNSSFVFVSAVRLR